MSLLARMQKRIADQKASFSGGFDNSFYNYYDLPFGEVIAMRLLPALDSVYDQPFTKRIMVPMTFTNPADENKPIKFNAPCLEMYGPEHEYRGMNSPAGCPLLRMVRPIYKESEALTKAGQTTEGTRLKDVANKHWTGKTTQVWYQMFPISSPLKEQNVPENPIRIFSANKEIHKKLYDSIFDNKVDPFKTLPMGEFSIDDVNEILTNGDSITDERAAALIESFMGFNFNLKLSEKGRNPETNKPYRDWVVGSSWARDASSLTDEHLAALGKYGFHDLRAKLPVQPSEAKYARMMEMMEKSIERAMGGEDFAWDTEWEKPLGATEQFPNGEPGCIPMKQRDNAASETKPEGNKSSVSVKTPSAASAVASKLAGRGKPAPVVAPTPEPVTEPVTEKVTAPEATTPEVEAPKVETQVTPTKAGPSASVAAILSRVRKTTGQPA